MEVLLNILVELGVLGSIALLLWGMVLCARCSGSVTGATDGLSDRAIANSASSRSAAHRTPPIRILTTREDSISQDRKTTSWRVLRDRCGTTYPPSDSLAAASAAP